MGTGLRPRAKVLDKPPDPNVGAPLLDSTEFRGSFLKPSVPTRRAHEVSYSLLRRGDSIDPSREPESHPG